MLIKKKEDFVFLISEDEDSLDIVFTKPIYINGVKVNELNFQFSYFWDWLVMNQLNLRVENRYDEISETTTQTARIVDKEQYLTLTQAQHKMQITKFINDYKNKSL